MRSRRARRIAADALVLIKLGALLIVGAVADHIASNFVESPSPAPPT